MFDNVSDRHDPNQTPLVDNRNMTEFSVRHTLHDVGDWLALVAGFDLACHRLTHWLSQCGSAPLGKRANDIALRDQTGDAVLGAKNERRANPLFGQKLHNIGKTGAGFDGDDLTALCSNDDFNSHFSSLCFAGKNRFGWLRFVLGYMYRQLHVLSKIPR